MRPLRPLSRLSRRSTSSAERPRPEHQVQRNLGVEGTAARGHHQAVERAEAHRGVGRPPVGHGRGGCAAAEMAHHKPQLLDRAAQEPAGPLEAPVHREPVESVPADAPLLPPPPRHRVGGRLRGQAGVERRVEHRDLGYRRQRGHRRADRLQGRRVVERRQLGQGLQPVNDLVVEDGGGDEGGAAVDHPMADRDQIGRCVGRGLDGGPALVVVDQPQLDPRQPGVDDEDAAHADEVSPTREPVLAPRRGGGAGKAGGRGDVRGGRGRGPHRRVAIGGGRE